MAAPTAATSAPGDLAPAIMGWDTLPLGTRLRSAFHGAQIRMATDAKAAAAAEVHWGAPAGFDPRST
ncbi:MAG TPA: hypothetical protein VG253_24315 [Streptosporangiaceae bacterium]|nr:hypothetical protein [Streptosporangiaceae bacterium]